MQTVRSLKELEQARSALRGTVALVPTMGALHAGHLKLVQEARRIADKVIVSIYVNPTQFGPGEDLARYPRQEAQDSRLLERSGCDVLWLPQTDDLYPAGIASDIAAPDVATRWEGEVRPGHFDGVATIVSRLFAAVSPDSAVFGEKDFQQLAVIRALVADRGIPVDIVGMATVRDPDGLALSSRNAYLGKEERKLALALPIALERARSAIRSGELVAAALAAAKAHLVANGFLKVDYVALVEAATLEPLEAPSEGPMRLIAAATIGSTRLLDNLAV